MKPPCMMVVQYILPALRVEIAKELSGDYDLRNAEIARKTPPIQLHTPKGRRALSVP